MLFDDKICIRSYNTVHCIKWHYNGAANWMRAVCGVGRMGEIKAEIVVSQQTRYMARTYAAL